MSAYIVRLYAESRVRISQKHYFEQGEATSFTFNLPEVTVTAFDDFVQIGELHVAKGLIIQVRLDAPNIDVAVDMAKGMAIYILSIFSCVAMASVSEPRPLWAYDVSPGVQNRDYRIIGYDQEFGDLNTRRVDHAALIAFLNKNFNSFLSNDAIRDDWKLRVQQAIQSFRRAMADNDDSLTEFIIAWTSMEGLDCVYRKLLPSAQTREFMGGVKDALARLGRDDVFDALKDLRDGLAHGNISLHDAIATSKEHLDLVRRALLLMVLRIIGVEQAVSDKVLARRGYKGSFMPLVRFIATIRFEPGDATKLEGHPIVELVRNGAEVAAMGDRLEVRPTWQLTPRNLESMTVSAHELWGDAGARPDIGHPELMLIRRPQPG